MHYNIVKRARDALLPLPQPVERVTHLLLLVLIWVRAGGPRLQLTNHSPQRLVELLIDFVSPDEALQDEFRWLQKENPLHLAMAVDAAKELIDGQSSDPLPGLYELPEILSIPFALQSGLVQLLVGLLQPERGQRLYAPWDQTGQLAALLADGGYHVRIDNPDALGPSLMALAYGDLIQVNRRNPITGRGTDSGVELDADGAVSFLPIGMRIDQKLLDPVVHNDAIRERTSSAAVLGIRQLLACTQGRIVVAVQNNVLFSSGAEYILRKELLLRGWLKAVVAMPTGLIDQTGLGFSVLILEPRSISRTVRFVNADSARFKVSTSRTRWELRGVEELLRVVLGAEGDTAAADVSVQDILANDSQLQVSRYVIPQEAQQMRRVLSNARTVALESIAAFVRPVPLSSDKDKVAEASDSWLDITHAVEVVSADIPDHGFVKHPTKEVYIDTTKFNLEANFLRPHDIILMIKGSTGKVGITPGEVSTFEPMVAGQSAIVLRVSESSPIDPRALFMQLRSPLGQALLRSIVSGASQPLIQLKELKRLQVIVPTQEEQGIAIQALEEEARIQEQIDALRERQARVSCGLWQLNQD